MPDLHVHVIPRYRGDSWFDFVRLEGHLRADESRALDEAGAFLRDLETTEPTRCLKLITLEALLEGGALGAGMPLQEAVAENRPRCYGFAHVLMTNPATSLELRPALAGPRYYLADRLVPGGSVVQLCFSGGWVTGRFEWSGDTSARPRFSCSIELEGGGVAEHVVEIPERALMRWSDA